MREIIEKALTFLNETDSCVLALVAETWGSAPRQAGSLMVVGADGSFEGSVSGGCVEGTVITEAMALIGRVRHKSLSYSVSSDDAWQVGLACGGKIRIELFHLSAADRPALDATITAISERSGGSLLLNKATDEAKFKNTLIEENLLENEQGCCVKVSVSPRLFVTGAVHIAQALAPMAISCGYDVTIIDPRGIFTDNRDFGGARIENDWPDEVLTPSTLDRETAIVTLTHDPKIDDVALKAALNSDVFYIGALGSKKTHAARLKRFESLPTPDRIHGPIGLDIGSRSPAEIAVSIMAEMIMKKRKPDAL